MLYCNTAGIISLFRNQIQSIWHVNIKIHLLSFFFFFSFFSFIFILGSSCSFEDVIRCCNNLNYSYTLPVNIRQVTPQVTLQCSHCLHCLLFRSTDGNSVYAYSRGCANNVTISCCENQNSMIKCSRSCNDTVLCNKSPYNPSSSINSLSRCPGKLYDNSLSRCPGKLYNNSLSQLMKRYPLVKALYMSPFDFESEEHMVFRRRLPVKY